mmetsp:Transcript_6565/g.14303  ORF Transcript_6565/g.14303 Transcript_6565/m.14303 type:complete len:827 (+) Transcript_6565:80-2560(+)
MGDEAGEYSDDDWDFGDGKPDAVKLKRRIRTLQEEQQRTKDYEDRLVSKLSKLEADLAEKREEVESLTRTLELERNKDTEDEKARSKERADKAKQREERIRNDLIEVLYTKPSSKASKKAAFELDTVLVSFAKPNETVRYILKFRIDNSTTIQKLRRNVCEYWGVREDEYVLKTMANSKCQNEIKVKDCFKQGEIAQLRLVMRDRYNTEVTDAERKAIVPRGKSKTARSHIKQQERLEAIKQHDNDYRNELKKLGGVYHLLKLREVKPTEHVNKIKLRDMIVYTGLALLIFITYNYRREPSNAYWCRRGFEQALVRSVYLPEEERFISPQHEITEVDAIWDFLNYTVADTIWDSSPSSLSSYNNLVGYLNIRVKNVREPSSASQDCEDGLEVIVGRLETSCYAKSVNRGNEQKDLLQNVERYWNFVTGQTSNIRGPELPYVWRSDSHNFEYHNIHTTWGQIQQYDAAGYSVAYRMQEPSFVSEFKQDMAEFRRMGWINGTRTRFVSVDFVAYNVHYDQWMNSRFVFEVVPGGAVIPSYFIRGFKPNIMETRQEITLTLAELIQVLLALYILFFVGSVERRHKILQQKASGLYYLSVSGMCDMLIIILIFTNLIWRTVVFSADTSTVDFVERLADGNSAQGFYDANHLAYLGQWIYILQGVLFLVVMHRLTTLARLGRQVYMMWHMLGFALARILFFFGIFIPTVLVFSLVAYKVYGPAHYDFRNIGVSLLQVYRLVFHSGIVFQVIDTDYVWTIVIFSLLFLVFRYLLWNTFAAIVIEANYTVQLAQFRHGTVWKRKNWKTWAVPALLFEIVRDCLGDAGESSANS